MPIWPKVPPAARSPCSGDDQPLLRRRAGARAGLGRPALAASPYGSDPATASIGFTDGKAAGSASPLSWAQAQELRLIASLGTGHNVDTPAVTTARYITSGPPGSLPVTITAPAQGSTLTTATTAVTGTTTPGSAVSVEAADTRPARPPP